MYSKNSYSLMKWFTSKISYKTASRNFKQIKVVGKYWNQKSFQNMYVHVLVLFLYAYKKIFLCVDFMYYSLCTMYVETARHFSMKK